MKQRLGKTKGVVLAMVATIAGASGCLTGEDPDPAASGQTVEAVSSACTISISSPQTATGSTWGNIVHVDAVASCPVGTPEIEYFTRVGNNQWQIAKSWSTATTLDYDTHNALIAGTLQFYALVRTQGTMESPTMSATISIALADNVPSCTSVKLTAPTTGQSFVAGTNVTLTGVAVCPQTPEYRYYVRAPGSSTFSAVGGYVPGSTTWTPPNVAGTWQVQVVARVVGAHVDSQVRSSGVNVTITAAAANQPPVVGNVTMTVAENSGSNVGTGSGSDPDGDALTVTGVGSAGHGATATLGGMNFSYAPAALYAGSDSFSYTVDDGHGHAVNGTVFVTVTTQNPVPGSHQISTPKNVAVNANLAAGDSDPDGDPVSVTAVGLASNGAVALQLDGTVTYTPNAGFVGIDGFTYTLSDGHGGTAQGNVTVFVTNGSPVANDDGPLTTRGNTALTGIAVLGNDTDPDGDPLTVTAVQSPSTNGGTVTTNGTTVDYTPANGFLGSDTFTYTISDGLTTASATVTVNVNELPVACSGGTVTVQSNGTASFDALAVAGCADADGDTLTITGVSPGATHGTLTVGASGPSSYSPFQNYVGGDGFTFTVSDGHGQSTSTSITITVTNQAPTANTDSVTTNKNVVAQLNLLGNDSDPDGGTLSASLLAAPTHGTAVVNANGTGTYTPATDYVGPDAFTYTLSDGQGGTATGIVNVTVNQLSAGCTVSISAESSILIGQDIHLVATASCNTGAAEIQWVAAKPGSNFMVVKAYNVANATFTYTPAQVGTMQFYAQVRTQGTTVPVATSSTIAVVVNDTVASCTSVKMVLPTNNTAATGGSMVTLQALATCPAGTSPEYQFWVKKSTDSTYTFLPGYTTTTSTWTVPVGQPGTWNVTAVARSIGAHVAYQVRANSVNVIVN